MPRSLRLLLIVGCAAALLHQPLRLFTFRVFRFPLTAVERAASVLVHLPQLPGASQEAAALRRQLAEQAVEVAQLRESVRRFGRAAELAEALAPLSGLTVSVIGRDLSPTEHLLLVNRGRDHDLPEHGILVDHRGLIGRVIERRATTSTAMLLTDPDSRLAARLERSGEIGLVVGTGDSLCRLAHVEMDADVAVGDRVVTAGLGGLVPAGLLIGTVTKVVRDDRRAEVAVWVKPAVRLGQLEDAWCVRPPSPSSASAP